MHRTPDQRFGMTSSLRLTALGCALALVSIGSGADGAISISTATGAGADAEFREAATGNGSGRGNAGDLNARWNPGGNNELFALRFDLTGIDRTEITSAAIELTSHRTGSADKGLLIAGLNSTETQNWAETVNFGNMPGLVHDNDLNTRAVDGSKATPLGTLAWTTAPTAGEILSFSSQELVDFLNTNGAGDLVTFFFEAADIGTTQLRFTSKEASALGSTSNPDTGTPKTGLEARLIVDTTPIPEPAGLSLLGLGAVGLLRRRRH